MLRGLIHHWRLHAAVAAAVAVCAAVLTGALLVGDSVRGSLRDLTLDRLGRIDHALTADRFFPDSLAARIAAGADGVDIASAVLLRGSMEHADSGARATRVGVLGVEAGFFDLWRESPVSETFAAGAGSGVGQLDLSRRPGQVFPSVALNESLAGELGAAPGDQVLLRFQLGSAIPRDTLLGDRESTEVVGTLRAEVVEVIPDRGAGRFELNPHQTFPRNAFVDRSALQAALEQQERVNALLLALDEDAPAPVVEDAVELADLGLTVKALEDQGVLEVTSDEFVLRPPVVEALERAVSRLGGRALGLQAYLANELVRDQRAVPYSMVTALEAPAPEAGLGVLRTVDGEEWSRPLGPRDLLLSAWTADELQARVGDTVTMSFYVVGADEQLRTESASFEVVGITAMEGLAVDPELTPEYPGIEGVENIADWDPPFPVDLSRIRPQDEAYWDEYRAAPKAFVAAATGRELWATRYGALTSARVSIPTTGDAGAEELASRLADALRAELDPADFGLRLLPVKQEGLDASAGATDFGGLFIGFSFFLIVSALMIVALLFGLGIAQRAGEIGLLRAVGYTPRRVRNRLLAEGAAVAAAGALLGLAGAVLYGRLLMLALTTVWLPAVGSPLLFLYVRPATLALGWAISMLVALGSILHALRGLRKVGITSLLKGVFRIGGTVGRRRARLRARVAAATLAGGVVVLLAGMASGAAASPAVAFVSGSLLLTAGITGFSAWCREGRGRLRRPGNAAAGAMARRNAGWSPGRSVLSVGLVASAAFVLVTVAGNTRDPASEEETVRSGAGGFQLVATTDVPVHSDLASAEDRFELGLAQRASELLAASDVSALRLLPGDDASCLNLYRPQRPRLLGVPSGLRARGGFHFGATLAEEQGLADPWGLLELDLGPGVIPALGDANSTQWILHLGLGDELEVEDERGNPLRLRIVGLMRESIFQSELLISEENLLRHFPGRSGFSYFLLEAPEGRADELAALLEADLGRYGFDAVSTADKLAGYLVVQNTYLSTFQMLGGLGLLLGTVGLGIILVRNVVERRGELATLRAFGFRRGFLTRMVLAENAFLLAVGTAIGAGSALAAISPRYLLGAVEVPWGTLAPTLGAVLVVGMLASTVAVALALRIPLLPALKSDR